MALTVLLSAGGAPGVTTTALALTLAWPRKVVLAECDRSGGAVLAGLWGGSVSAGQRGLLYLALDAQQNTAGEVGADLWKHVLPLDDDAGRYVLPGVTDPVQSRQLVPAWPALTAALTAADGDVIADTGRFDCDDELSPLLAAATNIVMVIEPVIRQIVAARPRLAHLTRYQAPAGLVTVGHGPFGSDGPRQVADTLGTPLLYEFPDDKTAARVLSCGAAPRRDWTRSPLMRVASAAARILAEPLTEPAEAALEVTR
jgi:hypothetical protein